MSTDYKIGIVVGLVVLIAGIVYFLTSGEGDKLAPPISAPTTEPNTVVDTTTHAPAETTPGAVTPTEISLDTLTPRTQPAAVTPAVGVTVPTQAPTPGDTTEWQLDEDAEEAATPAETPSRGVTDTVKIRVAPEAEEEGFELTEDADTAWSEPEPEPEIRPIQRPTETTATVGAAGGTYVVKKGDIGLWIIAERVYGPGNGKYWTLIQKANPTADTNALREGQMLKIPALPAAAVRPADTASTSVTRVEFDSATPGTPSPGGNREYVVTEGDAGLWGIAEKFYGKGQLWEVIQKANPGVKPSALRVGMKLVIPPLPTASTTRPGGATTPGQTTKTTPDGSARRRGEVFTENDRQYYIVQAGDQGYWGIARKVYGDGKYSYLIDRANTGVDSFSLQPGDKLEVPPIPATTGGQTQPARPRPTRSTPAPTPLREGEPDFGP